MRGGLLKSTAGNLRNIVVPNLSEVEPLGRIAGDEDLFTDYLIG